MKEKDVKLETETMVREGNKTGGQQDDHKYSQWLLEAIRKIKQQKQQPNIERITAAMRQHQGQVSQSLIQEKLDIAVKTGVILKVINRGTASYKDPARVVTLATRKLKVDKNTNLTKILLKSIRELGESGGSTLKTIEKYVKTSYSISVQDKLDLSSVIRTCARKAVSCGKLELDGRSYRIHTESSSDSGGDDYLDSELRQRASKTAAVQEGKVSLTSL